MSNSPLNFMAPERHEGESMEVYRLRLQQAARHAKAIQRGYRRPDPVSDRTKEVRRAQRDLNASMGARQAKKLRREMRESAKKAHEAAQQPAGIA